MVAPVVTAVMAAAARPVAPEGLARILAVIPQVTVEMAAAVEMVVMEAVAAPVAVAHPSVSGALKAAVLYSMGRQISKRVGPVRAERDVPVRGPQVK